MKMLETIGLIVVILICIKIFGSFSKDDTDGKERSGLILYTDHRTGVQYVGPLFGGVTPRLDKDGKPYIKN